MLIIRRRPGQSVVIGEGIEIEVLEAGPQKVKLGITAPAGVTVCRKEVELTRQQNILAAEGPSAETWRRLSELLRPAKPASAE